MRNLAPVKRLSGFFGLSALVILISCATPKYYQFKNNTTSSEITSDTLMAGSPFDDSETILASSFPHPNTLSQLPEKSQTDSTLLANEEIILSLEGIENDQKMAGVNTMSSIQTPKVAPVIEKRPEESELPPMNKIARLAFIFSLVPVVAAWLGLLFTPTALVLGIIGLKETKKSGERGWGLARAAVIISSVFIFVFTLLVLVFLISYAGGSGELKSA